MILDIEKEIQKETKGVAAKENTKENIKKIRATSSTKAASAKKEDIKPDGAEESAEKKGTSDMSINKDKVITPIESFISVIKRYKIMGYKYLSIDFQKQARVRVLLDGFAFGELKEESKTSTLEENVKYSVKNGYIKNIYTPTTVEAVGQMLFFANALNVESTSNNAEIKGTTALAINTELETIVSIKAYKDIPHRLQSSSYYAASAIESKHHELFNQIKSHI